MILILKSPQEWNTYSQRCADLQSISHSLAQITLLCTCLFRCPEMEDYSEPWSGSATTTSWWWWRGEKKTQRRISLRRIKVEVELIITTEENRRWRRKATTTTIEGEAKRRMKKFDTKGNTCCHEIIKGELRETFNRRRRCGVFFSGILGLFALYRHHHTAPRSHVLSLLLFLSVLLLSRNSNSWCGVLFCVYIICCEWINKFFFVRLLLSAAAAIWERSNERGNLSKKSRLCSDCVFLLCFAVES